ncbi:hypothetical protein V6N13_020987 [Hibiscus sabdariffa]|uniref:Flavin-containing monooxygenase n=1 Tax=Hibiscus sabdariffa TaxID=183260 RepID=A0ABR2EV45_9ROSI
MGRSYKVAVIGAGTAGLVTARELQREGHHVTVFEKANKVGGTWLYDPRVETDPLGIDPNREIVHSSLYKSLRVNVPRQVMGFLDYPFVKKEGGDPRSFPCHKEVLRFLEDFARDFGLMELIRFGNEVVRVEPVDESQKLQNFQIVVIIGNGPSAIDILKEISPIAEQVHHAVRGPDIQLKKLENHDNIWQHSMIKCAHEDGKVVFRDGSIVFPDIILHCTGYKFHFPFLLSNGIITVDDNRVGPLYKHVFPPSLAPCLSFVGIPYMGFCVVLELQAKWVAKVLCGKLKLPTQEEMAYSVEQFYCQMEKRGWPKRFTHNLQHDEVEYKAWLAAQMDVNLPKLLKEATVFSLVKARSRLGDDYRDTWDVDQWMQQMEVSD